MDASSPLELALAQFRRGQRLELAALEHVGAYTRTGKRGVSHVGSYFRRHRLGELKPGSIFQLKGREMMVVQKGGSSTYARPTVGGPVQLISNSTQVNVTTPPGDADVGRAPASSPQALLDEIDRMIATGSGASSILDAIQNRLPPEAKAAHDEHFDYVAATGGGSASDVLETVSNKLEELAGKSKGDADIGARPPDVKLNEIRNVQSSIGRAKQSVKYLRESGGSDIVRAEQELKAANQELRSLHARIDAMDSVGKTRLLDEIRKEIVSIGNSMATTSGSGRHVFMRLKRDQDELRKLGERVRGSAEAANAQRRAKAVLARVPKAATPTAGNPHKKGDTVTVTDTAGYTRSGQVTGLTRDGQHVYVRTPRGAAKYHHTAVTPGDQTKVTFKPAPTAAPSKPAAVDARAIRVQHAEFQLRRATKALADMKAGKRRTPETLTPEGHRRLLENDVRDYAKELADAKAALKGTPAPTATPDQPTTVKARRVPVSSSDHNAEFGVFSTTANTSERIGTVYQVTRHTHVNAPGGQRYYKVWYAKYHGDGTNPVIAKSLVTSNKQSAMRELGEIHAGKRPNPNVSGAKTQTLVSSALTATPDQPTAKQRVAAIPGTKKSPPLLQGKKLEDMTAEELHAKAVQVAAAGQDVLAGQIEMLALKKRHGLNAPTAAPDQPRSGRGPSGQLRNIKSMSIEKLQGVAQTLAQENNDPEAMRAVTAELRRRTGDQERGDPVKINHPGHALHGQSGQITGYKRDRSAAYVRTPNGASAFPISSIQNANGSPHVPPTGSMVSRTTATGSIRRTRRVGPETVTSIRRTSGVRNTEPTIRVLEQNLPVLRSQFQDAVRRGDIPLAKNLEAEIKRIEEAVKAFTPVREYRQQLQATRAARGAKVGKTKFGRVKPGTPSEKPTAAPPGKLPGVPMAKVKPGTKAWADALVEFRRAKGTYTDAELETYRRQLYLKYKIEFGDTPSPRLQLSAKTPVLSTVHHPLGKPGGPGLFHHKGLQLPAYIQNIAHALIRQGHPESSAIAIAIGTVKRWARGGGKVSPEVRAAAAKAVAEWEKAKATH